MYVDISAVGPVMTRVAGEVADGVHVHPLHSMPYIENRLLPDLAAGAAKADRDVDDLELLIPVFAYPGDTPEERAAIEAREAEQIPQEEEKTEAIPSIAELFGRPSGEEA